MSEGTTVTVRIHFGGVMEKTGETYKYEGELGVKTKFLKFSREDTLINAPIRFIWYKEVEKEMKTLNYVYEGYSEDMFLLICVAKEKGEVEVFVEHDISEHSEPPIYLVTPKSQREDVHEDEDKDLSSEKEVERPIEDGESD
ncbi:unnamed protein product [Eruca vesicaria subsp. sativa]|uniref:Uncharacterized protein n=1 Tax=Eruca vesicaria subsp. sativa TaxID=29727 RepID=A0ABC8L902_ERUVS|nr:unnamed protein product [Eruca vesicaria subsp. sativa]